jgi:hypothetical protein
MISQPWPSSFPYPTAAHAPLAPSPSRQNPALHHGRRDVRSIWSDSSRGGRTAGASTLARDEEKYPLHSTINRSVVQPARPLPRQVRRVITARHITGDASYARFGLVRAGGGVQHPHPPSREIKRKKYPPHSTINRRVVQPARPLPRQVRRVRTARHITGNSMYARFGLIRAGGGVRHPLPSSRLTRKNTPHTQQSIGGSSSRPHPSPARSVASKPRATSRATRRTLDSVNLTDGGSMASASIVARDDEPDERA